MKVSKQHNIVHKSMILLISVIIFMACSKTNVPDETTYPVIPTPQHIKYGQNEISFKSVSIHAPDYKEEGIKLVNFFHGHDIASSESGLQIEIKKGAIDHSTDSEAYQLKIDNKISIIAPTSAGAFYAIQTLKQLFRTKKRLCNYQS